MILTKLNETIVNFSEIKVLKKAFCLSISELMLFSLYVVLKNLHSC